MRLLVMVLSCALVTLAAGDRTASAETFRWGAQGDAATLDPHGLAEGFTLGFLGNVYEGLVRRGGDLSLEPALATSWEQTEPTVWRFTLRDGVAFHDGSPFTADDVAFSFERAAGEDSGIRNIVASIAEVRVIDDHKVDLVTKSPNPILPEEISNWLIMSRGWAEANGASSAASVKAGVEHHATNNANGTGPFRIVAREPDTRTEFAANPDWWDEQAHNIEQATFSPIGADATRVAALLSGEVDLIFPVPVQNVDQIDAQPGFSVLQGPEVRTIFLGLDQMNDRLESSDVEDANPFQDRRVREAIYRAIDVEAIREKAMRGASTPAGLLIGPGINGFDPAMNERLPYDPEAAQALLAEAGYPDGFRVAMDCPNDRYVNDEAICQAIVSMLARIGIQVDLNTMTKSIYFKKLQDLDTDFYLLGWTSGTYDAHHPMRFLVHSRDAEKSLGSWNFGGYGNPEADTLIEAIGSEVDPAERQRMIDQVHTIHKDDIGHIPLHQQALAWGARDGIDVVQRADNFFNLYRVQVD